MSVRNLQSGSLLLLCTPSRLRPVCWAIALSLNSVTFAQDAECLPGLDSGSVAQAAEERTEQAAADQASEIDITSDNATLGVNGDAVLRGNVRVRQGDREIQAEDVTYDGDTNALQVKGKVEYTDPLVKLTGSDGQYSPTVGAQFNAAEFELQDGRARGTAQSLRMTPGGVLHLDNVTFTTCPIEDNSWRVKAGGLMLNTGEGVGSGRAARVDFKGVPILYLPWASFPIGTGRKSGFLFPSGGYSSRSGGQFAIPYYWNVAPNADLTFEPMYYGRRGTDLAGEMRYMANHHRTALEYHYLPNDQLTKNDPTYTTNDRSYVRLDQVTELPGRIRFSIDAANVSDDQYFQDFSGGPEGTSVAFVERLARLSYRDENWRIAAEAQNFQTIYSLLPQAQRPYVRTPRVVINSDYGLGKNDWFRYGFDSEVVNFDRSTGVTGWRSDVSPTIGLNFEGPGYFLRPGVAWRYTQYDLDNVAAGQDTSLDRSLPVASMDMGLLFERSSGKRGNRTITLEPRALYLYVPFETQDNLPIFDTALPDLNLVQLFRTNRYVGADRMSDANQISVGVTTRLLDADDGTQFLAATLGQTYWFKTPQVRIPGEVFMDNGRDQSDLVAQLSLTAYKDWNIDLGMQWDTENSRTRRSQVKVQYRPEEDRVANVGYRFQQGRLEQTELSGAWPIGRRWGVFARMVYSLLDETALERFGGIEYRACCWKMRAVGRRFVSNNTGEQDTGFYLQLELTGLASVGSGADTFLDEAIRGYSRPQTTR
jgi:LPS-assembly protein